MKKESKLTGSSLKLINSLVKSKLSFRFTYDAFAGYNYFNPEKGTGLLQLGCFIERGCDKLFVIYNEEFRDEIVPLDPFPGTLSLNFKGTREFTINLWAVEDVDQLLKILDFIKKYQ